MVNMDSRVRICDDCGYATRDWDRIAIMRNGEIAVNDTLCHGCADAKVEAYANEKRVLARG